MSEMNRPNTPSRRTFLASAALPLIAASPAAIAAPVGVCCDRRVATLAAARVYGALVPAWSDALRAHADSPRCADARRRFEEVDAAYDAAKRRLLRAMREAGSPIVVDRESAVAYLDCNPTGSHEDLDGLRDDNAIVRVVPLEKVIGLA